MSGFHGMAPQPISTLSMAFADGMSIDTQVVFGMPS
jgi:hypothetical protein